MTAELTRLSEPATEIVLADRDDGDRGKDISATPWALIIDRPLARFLGLPLGLR